MRLKAVGERIGYKNEDCGTHHRQQANHANDLAMLHSMPATLAGSFGKCQTHFAKNVEHGHGENAHEMTLDQSIAFAVLLIVLVLFVWGRWRYDIVAVGALLAVTSTELVTPAEALAGFSNSAVMTVAAVLAISRALSNSGVIDVATSHLRTLTENQTLHVASLTGVCAVASAFMNNVGAIALMLPVALVSCAERDRSPAIVLMPLAFASILGGLMTLIGTPPNIIIANFRGEMTGQPFGMFDYSPVGVPVAFVGVVFLALVGWRLVPRKRMGRKSADQLFAIEEYITEVRVKSGSSLIGKHYGEMEDAIGQDVVVAGRLHEDGKVTKPARRQIVAAGDILILKADPTDLKPTMDEFGLELYGEVPKEMQKLEADNVKIYEAVVGVESPLVGLSPANLRLRSGFTLHVLAVARAGEPIRKQIKNVDFRAGDVLLMQGDEDSAPDTLTALNLLPLPERGLTLGKPRKVWLALGIFAAALALNLTGALPIAIAFLGAVGAFVVTNVLPTRELYSHIDWPIIVLLGAMIPVGQALENTGATGLMAGSIVGMTQSLPLWGVLAVVMVVTMFLSDLINNAATALVMAPIAAAIAQELGVSVDPFLMCVAIGASCAFLTPIGHQSNTLVMGPAGYHFGDYWRVGLPLEALIVAMSIPLISWIWPLGLQAH